MGELNDVYRLVSVSLSALVSAIAHQPGIDAKKFVQDLADVLDAKMVAEELSYIGPMAEIRTAMLEAIHETDQSSG